jgi:methionine transaminase
MISKLPEAGTTIFAVMSALARRHQAINLAQGFPGFDPPEALRHLVTGAMSEGQNQYAPMPGLPALREAIARKILLSYGRRPDPESEITVTAGATQGLFCAIQALVHPGDEVIVLEPAYDSYIPAIRLAGGTPVPLPLLPPHFRPDWERIRQAVTARTRLIITNNPHNPTGTLFDAADLAELRALVLEKGLWLLSDEVYEHLTFDGLPHHSVLADSALYARSLVTFSFGKTFHATGWKTGYVVGPPALTAEYRKIHQYNVFSVHTPSQAALADYMQDPGVWAGLDAFYQRKRDFFLEALQGSSFRPLACQGTYFALLDYSALSDEDDLTFCRNYTERCGVALIPISPFYREAPADSRVARVCFAKTEELLSAAAGRMCSAVY